MPFCRFNINSVIDVTPLYVGFFAFSVCSCGYKPNTLVGDPEVASMSEHQASKLLRDTIIPIVDWPEQSIVDRLGLIDREASKVGLSVEMSPDLRSRPMKSPAFRERNIPLAVVIRATVDSTILRFRIKDSGILFFYLASEERSSPIPLDANSPFSAK